MDKQATNTFLGVTTRSYLWLLAGAVCLFFSNGYYDHAIAPWFCYLFFLHFFSTNSARAGLMVGAFVYGVVFGITMYLTNKPLGALIAPLVAIYFLITFLPYLIHRLTAHKFEGIRSTLVFPLVTVTLEFLVVPLLSTSYSWSKTQHENYILIQIASIAGISGVTFLMTWFASVGQYVLQHRTNRRACFRVALPYVIVFALAAGYGVVRFYRPVESLRYHRVATVVTPETGFARLHLLQHADISEFLRNYQNNKAHVFSQTETAAQQGAKLVLWQEYALFIPDTEAPKLIEEAARIADDKDIFLAISATVVSLELRTIRRNQIIIFDPEGNRVLSYDKVRPLPNEPIPSGDRIASVVTTPLGTIAAAICADADYPQLVRQAVDAKAELLLVPILEWEEIASLHFQMLNFRAIENGLSILRAGGDSISGAFDYRGRVLSKVHHAKENKQLMITDIPMHRVDTVYSVVGNLFSWICAVMFVSLWLRRCWRYIAYRLLRTTAR